jgi:hypothetical protein
MRISSTPRLLPTLLLAGFAAASLGATCGGDDEPELQWYQTCGDPVCGGYTPPADAVVCTDEAVGDPCGDGGVSCVIPDDGCNAALLCTDTDPAVNCPISQRAKKRDIAYLSAAEQQAIARRLLATRLARYHYRDQPDSQPKHLGFIIEDQPDSPAVLPRGDRVDVYGYTSMAVATIQLQARELAALRAEVQALRTEVQALRASAVQDINRRAAGSGNDGSATAARRADGR